MFRLMHSYCGRELNGDQRYFLAVDCRNLKGVPLNQRIFQGTAQETPPFVMGCRQWWGGAEKAICIGGRAAAHRVRR